VGASSVVVQATIIPCSTQRDEETRTRLVIAPATAPDRESYPQVSTREAPATLMHEKLLTLARPLLWAAGHGRGRWGRPNSRPPTQGVDTRKPSAGKHRGRLRLKSLDPKGHNKPRQ